MNLKDLLLQFHSQAHDKTDCQVRALISTYMPRFQRVIKSETLLTEKEVIALFPAIKLSMLRHWRHQGRGPKYIKTGSRRRHRLFYRLSDFEAWLESIEVEPIIS